MNGDGKPDLVVSVESTNSTDAIVVLFGQRQRARLAPIQAPVAGYPIALLDLNGDGIPDLVVGDSTEARNSRTGRAGRIICCGVST